MLNREQILQAVDLRLEKVDVPEWGGHVYVKTLNARELLAFSTGDDRSVTRLLTFAVCDADRTPLLTQADAAVLAEKNGKVIDRLASKALELNGLKPEQAEKN